MSTFWPKQFVMTTFLVVPYSSSWAERKKWVAAICAPLLIVILVRLPPCYGAREGPHPQFQSLYPLWMFSSIQKSFILSWIVYIGSLICASLLMVSDGRSLKANPPRYSELDKDYTSTSSGPVLVCALIWRSFIAMSNYFQTAALILVTLLMVNDCR